MTLYAPRSATILRLSGAEIIGMKAALAARVKAYQNRPRQHSFLRKRINKLALPPKANNMAEAIPLHPLIASRMEGYSLSYFESLHFATS